MKKEYFNMIEEAREVVEVNEGLTTLETLLADNDADDVVVVGDEEQVSDSEVGEVAEMYMDELLMEEGVDKEQPMGMRLPLPNDKESTFMRMYNKVEAWYIHEADQAYSLAGIGPVMAEAVKQWPKADVGQLYVIVLLVITKTTRENPEWGTCTVS